MIPFRPLSLEDKSLVQDAVYSTECRNCDFSFMNLMSWRFLYDTEIAWHKERLLLRFRTNGHVAYQMPVGGGDIHEVMEDLLEDARLHGHAFLMLGICRHALPPILDALPAHFYATPDRDHADYVYLREKLSTLSGKKLQPKRNHANRFAALYPHYTYEPLVPEDFGECKELEQRWAVQKEGNSRQEGYAHERKSMHYVLDHWEQLDGMGGILRVEGKVVAFTYGAAINRDTFDVCVEKADTGYEGAYAVINREFARHIPERFVYINREEDLGIEGLRKAKLSYQPEMILEKHLIMSRHPFSPTA